MSKMDSENEYVMKNPSVYFHERIGRGFRLKGDWHLRGYLAASLISISFLSV
jgi:hypothetical protein